MDIAKSVNRAVLGEGHKLNEIEKKAGVSIGFLSRVRSGQRDPGLRNIRKIADALGMKVSEFIALGED